MIQEHVPRVAIITIGQSPRPDVVPEIAAMLGDLHLDEFGALDGISHDEIQAQAPVDDEFGLFTRLANGGHVIIRARFALDCLEKLATRLDGEGYDLLVLATTGVFAPLSTRTPLVHGQHTVDAWIAALVVGDSRIGLVYPLPRQGSILSEFNYGTLLQSAHATVKGGHSAQLTDAIDRVSGADLILMHSVGYTEAMAKQVALASGKPVVTARRIIAGAARIRIAEITGHSAELTTQSYTGTDLLKRLREEAEGLTPREREVLVHVLEGGANKVIARVLGISHRTVEIHRARAMMKLGATSVTELIRRALMVSQR